MVFSLDDPVVQSYFLYSGILAIKLLALTILTGRVRAQRKAYVNPEDAKAFNTQVKPADPEVERVRRAHLNDLENILAFWFMGALYVTTTPEASWAILLFRVYTAFRILHSYVYAINPMPQPARFIAFFIPMCITTYMGIQVILHYKTAL